MEWGNIVERLRSRMRRHNISQRRLARAMGRAPTQVNRWFRHAQMPRLTSLARIDAAIESILQERKIAKLDAADGVRR